jgi:hypothetical protein
VRINEGPLVVCLAAQKQDRTWRFWKGLLLPLIVVLAITLSNTLVYAYDNDTHFYLTYYLAREMGFDRTEALRIARANVSMDWSLFLPPNASGIGPIDAVLSAGAAEEASAVVACLGYDPLTIPTSLLLKEFCLRKNSQWHAFRPWSNEKREALRADTQIRNRLYSLFDRACKEKRFQLEFFGQFLHFLQDSFAHQGFWSRSGHGPRPQDLPLDLALGGVAGHFPDYLSYNASWDLDTEENEKPGTPLYVPQKADKMVFATLRYMEEFLRRCFSDPGRPRRFVDFVILTPTPQGVKVNIADRRVKGADMVLVTNLLNDEMIGDLTITTDKEEKIIKAPETLPQETSRATFLNLADIKGLSISCTSCVVELIFVEYLKPIKGVSLGDELGKDEGVVNKLVKANPADDPNNYYLAPDQTAALEALMPKLKARFDELEPPIMVGYYFDKDGRVCAQQPPSKPEEAEKYSCEDKEAQWIVGDVSFVPDSRSLVSRAQWTIQWTIPLIGKLVKGIRGAPLWSIGPRIYTFAMYLQIINLSAGPRLPTFNAEVYDFDPNKPDFLTKGQMIELGSGLFFVVFPLACPKVADEYVVGVVGVDGNEIKSSGEGALLDPYAELYVSIEQEMKQEVKIPFANANCGGGVPLPNPLHGWVPNRPADPGSAEVTLSIKSIKVHDDKDPLGAGELNFDLVIYTSEGLSYRSEIGPVEVNTDDDVPKERLPAQLILPIRSNDTKLILTAWGWDDDWDNGSKDGVFNFLGPLRDDDDPLEGVVKVIPVPEVGQGSLREVIASSKDFEITFEVTGAPAPDRTPPRIQGAIAPPPNRHGWHDTDVIVSFECSDDLSGIESCTGPQVVSTEGANQFVVGEAKDKAGNVATIKVGPIHIDKTPPRINTFTLSADKVFSGQSIGVRVCATDALSSLDIVFAEDSNLGTIALVRSPSSGCWEGSITPTSSGNIEAVAIDKAGNEAHSSRAQYTVEQNQPPIAFLRGPIEEGCAGAGCTVEVRLDGSDSEDFDGEIVKYEWDFGDGQRMSGANLDTVTHTYPLGQYKACLKVTDDKGATDFSCTTVLVKLRPGKVPPQIIELKLLKSSSLFYGEQVNAIFIKFKDPDGDVQWVSLEGNVKMRLSISDQVKGKAEGEIRIPLSHPLSCTGHFLIRVQLEDEAGLKSKVEERTSC